jgi:hypothetical protein
MLSYVRTMYDYIRFALTSVDEGNMTDSYRTEVSEALSAVSALSETSGSMTEQIAALSQRIIALETSVSDLSERVTALEGGTE